MHLERGHPAAADAGQQPLVDDGLQRVGQLHPDLRLARRRGRRRRCGRCACAESLVCSVANTRWPVSAMVSAVWMVSRSRISPISSTSGSSRSAERSPRANDSVSSPTSRWLTAATLCRCTYSIGSSIVRMWHGRVELIASIIAASVVDLPEPVAPVTSTRPCGSRVRPRTTCGQPQVVEVRQGVRDHPQRDRDAAALAERVDPEPGLVAPAEREVELLAGLELLALARGQDAWASRPRCRRG